MIPISLVGLEAQLWVLMIAMIRPGAAFLAAPVFGNASVPVQLRLVIAAAIGVPALSHAQIELPVDGLVSVEGFMLIASEALAGLAMGFAVQIGFGAALVAGETIGNAMGLGFASMVDPLTGGSTPALGQFLSVLTTLIFLAIGGHLMLITTVVESYRTLPPGDAWLGAQPLNGLVLFGGSLFATGLAIALPVGFALILVQLVMGMLARSAPSLNLFAVGLPATLLVGLLLLVIAAPAMGDAIAAMLARSLAEARAVVAGG